jgi:hypothetical protein
MPLILAHGVGGRSDLPVPLAAAQYAAIAALVLTFLLLSRTWRTPKFEQPGGRALPTLQRIVDSSITTAILRAVGGVLLFTAFTTAAFGDDSAALNPAPTWLYVWLWVGLIPLSLLFGPIVGRLDPLPVVTKFMRDVASKPQGWKPYPERLGFRPAAIGLLVFAWLELVAPDRDEPTTVAWFIALYVGVHVVGGIVFGDNWHRNSGAFGTYSRFVAHLSPWLRTDSGDLRFANPFRNLARMPVGPASLNVVIVLLGSTAFDGFTRTQMWTDWSRGKSELALVFAGTLALVVCVAVVSVVFRTATLVNAAHVTTGISRRSVSVRFAGSLVPIVIGYAVAHYFSLFVFQGQAGYLLLVDDAVRIDYSFITSEVIAWVQLLAIVTGHLVGVIAAHDKTAALFPPAAQRTAQLPLMLVMVMFTWAGIGLLLGA